MKHTCQFSSAFAHHTHTWLRQPNGLNMCLCICFLSLQKKKSALFEVAEVVPVMTNNYEENIFRGVRDSSYSLESSIELLQKDVVQLHAPRYQSMRRVSWCTIWGADSLKKTMYRCVWRCVSLLVAVGCDRLHTGDGLHPLATQRYWEDCLSAVLQMEGGRWWTLQACSGQNLAAHQITQALNVWSMLKPLILIRVATNFFHYQLILPILGQPIYGVTVRDAWYWF